LTENMEKIKHWGTSQLVAQQHYYLQIYCNIKQLKWYKLDFSAYVPEKIYV
jgi:uncharacterized protein YlbG (UPF0298 family)